MSEHVHVGNAGKDADASRGWLIGRFIDGGVRQTSDVEIKWGIHPKGQQRAEWTRGESRHTLLMLIEGRFRIELSTGTYVLAERGDYVVWGPGIEHTWYAEEDSVMLTVRWPSIEA